MRPVILTLALLFPVPAPSQEAAPKVPTLTGPDAGAYGVEFNISGVPKGLGVLWDVTPQVKDLTVRQVKVEKAVIIYGPPGQYKLRVRLISSDKDGNVDVTEVPERAFTLTGGGGPTPPVPPGPTPPGPQPPPTPPAPVVDPFVTSLQKAAAAAGWEKVKLKGLAVAFREAQRQTGRGMTVGQLLKAHAEVLATAFPAGIPDPVRDLLGTKLKPLDAVLPPAQKTRVLKEDELALVTGVLGTLADACEEASK